MSVQPVKQSINTVKYNKTDKNNQPSFGGSFNPLVSLMDAIDKGGFAASFIAQDGIGMVAPRIYEGLNRNRQKDENGKKTGPLNWEFARREGIREILSGPSAFLIPLGILSVVKKTSGTANNVHVNHIQTLGDNLVDYTSKNHSKFSDLKEFKKGYYTQIFENALSHSTDESFDGKELKQKAQEFAQKLVDAEELRKTKGSKKDSKALLAAITDEYMSIRKSHSAASGNELGVYVKDGEKTLATNIRKLTQSLTDYTNDALSRSKKYLQNNSADSLSEFLTKFNKHRAGTRVLSNLGMWGAVVSFYTLIPKLYNMGIKHDPGLKGLESEQANAKQTNKDVAFTGGFSKLGETAMKEGGLSKIFKNFEFNGASMPVPAMLTLLFGFTLPPRYINAKSDKERKEIVVRDITSFGAILFAAKAMARGFSDLFAKMSGLALNIKPEDHNKGFLHKLKNYFTAGQGIDVLTSEQIVSKYSKIDGYKDGINGFFNFLEENGGNVKKVLNSDSDLKGYSESIMETFGNGKSLKEATLEEIHTAFKNAKNSEQLNKIYKIFESDSNKFINRAKTMNSAFGFVSTLALVPAFMMWLARYCERMTKRAVEKEKAMNAQNQQAVEPLPVNTIATSKPTMAGFINN